MRLEIENLDHVDEQQENEVSSDIASEKSLLARLSSEDSDLF